MIYILQASFDKYSLYIWSSYIVAVLIMAGVVLEAFRFKAKVVKRLHKKYQLNDE